MIFILCGAVYAIYAAYTLIAPSSAGDWVELCFLGTLSIVMGALAGSGFALGVGYFPAQTFMVEDTVHLAALRDNSTVRGSFFLGSGSIGQEQRYFYMRKVGDGFKQDSIAASEAIVYEQDGEPRIVTYQSDFVNPMWYVIGLPSKSKDADIYVPVGSIVQNYHIDLQ